MDSHIGPASPPPPQEHAMEDQSPAAVESGGPTEDQSQTAVESGGLTEDLSKAAVESGGLTEDLIQAAVESGGRTEDLIQAAVESDGLEEDQSQAAVESGGLEEDQRQVAVESGGLTEDLKCRIIKQVEYYFSDENLPTDKYMISLIKKNKGFVPVAMIASFRKVKRLIRDNALVATALRDSSFLVVSADGKKVKRLVPFALPLAAMRDSQLYTVLVENLPEDHSVENIRRIFGEAGNIKTVCIHDPTAVVESSKGDKVMSCKLHALVEYETIEAAEKAVATLNNEQDWRNGMRVKLLKKMEKPGKKKQSWRVPPEHNKDQPSRVADQLGDAGNHNLNELNGDIPDEENGAHLHKDNNGAHLHKEKNEMKGRNRGRSGRQRQYGGANGMGHGSGQSSQPMKPPPGPRMPDGSRGFTMGRGRTQTSDLT